MFFFRGVFVFAVPRSLLPLFFCFCFCFDFIQVMIMPNYVIQDHQDGRPHRETIINHTVHYTIHPHRPARAIYVQIVLKLKTLSNHMAIQHELRTARAHYGRADVTIHRLAHPIQSSNVHIRHIIIHNKIRKFFPFEIFFSNLFRKFLQFFLIISKFFGILSFKNVLFGHFVFICTEII